MTLTSCLGTVLLVHTGHDAEHLGLPSTEGNTARSAIPRKTSPACATAGVDDERTMSTVLLVHTSHDAEHPGPGDDRREHNARCITTSKTSITHKTVLHVHTNHEAWKLRPADDRREHSVGSTETRKEAKNM